MYPFVRSFIFTVCLFLSVSVVAIGDVVNMTQEIMLSEDEAISLKLIMNRENLLKEMSRAVDGLDALNKAAGWVVQGPTKIVVRWNKSLIDGWRKANNAMDRLATDATCKEIRMNLIDIGPNQVFWENMESISSCN